MTDVLTPGSRSYCMSQIRGKHTKPEYLIRRLLFADGFRYRLHDQRLPGKPDLVFPKHRAVIFVHGCFWHGHECHLFKVPATNRAFWLSKIKKNQENDSATVRDLRRAGWRVMTVWECALRSPSRLKAAKLAAAASAWLRSHSLRKTIRGRRP